MCGGPACPVLTSGPQAIYSPDLGLLPQNGDNGHTHPIRLLGGFYENRESAVPGRRRPSSSRVLAAVTVGETVSEGDLGAAHAAFAACPRPPPSFPPGTMRSESPGQARHLGFQT